MPNATLIDLDALDLVIDDSRVATPMETNGYDACSTDECFCGTPVWIGCWS